MDEFGLVWLSSVWFDEVDFLKCSRSASQLSFTNLFSIMCSEHFVDVLCFQETESTLVLLWRKPSEGMKVITKQFRAELKHLIFSLKDFSF